MTGTVKWFNLQKGFGFIGMTPADKLQFGIAAEVDLFVHSRAIVGKFPRKLTEGQRVTFDVVRNKKGDGWEASNVVADEKVPA